MTNDFLMGAFRKILHVVARADGLAECLIGHIAYQAETYAVSFLYQSVGSMEDGEDVFVRFHASDVYKPDAVFVGFVLRQMTQEHGVDTIGNDFYLLLDSLPCVRTEEALQLRAIGGRNKYDAPALL